MNKTKDQVFQLFVGKMSGTISAEEEHALEQRLLVDPVFRKEWQELEDKASELGMGTFLAGLDAEASLKEFRTMRPLAPRDDSAKIVSLADMSDPANHADLTALPSASGRPVRYRRMLAVAAAILLAVAGWWLWLTRDEKIVDKARIAGLVKEQQPSVRLDLAGGKQIGLGQVNAGKTIAVGNTTLQSGLNTLQYTSQDTSLSTLSVPAGATYKIVLSDGTEVWLNAATRLRFPMKFPSGHRDVDVEGEAFFKVAKNVAAPFVVHTSLTDVQVLGTSFNVNSYDKGSVRTALVEGKVSTFHPGGPSLSLEPGYVADYDVSKGFSSSTFEQEDELSWMNGVYYFHDMTIDRLVELASRCYGIRIVLTGEKIKGQSLTGVLEKDKMAEFLQDLETTAHIKYYYSNKDLYLE
jgi:ferric-dicitrate binding protein FerR (iron transport regulator)